MTVFKAVILKGGRNEKSDGTTNIKIRVTHRKKVNYISTDLYIYPKQMNNKEGMVISGENIAFINLLITNLLQKYRKGAIELGEDANSLNVKELKDFLIDDNYNIKKIDFLVFAYDCADKTKVAGTSEQYFWLAESIKSFTGTILPFSEINLNFLFRYEAFLRSRGVGNGIINYMTTFRSLFNKARNLYNDEDTGKIIIPNYPFRKYQMPKRILKSNEHILSVDEFKIILNYKTRSIGDKFAKDMFLLMFYLIGIEAKDLFYLKKPIKDRIYYDRYKTGRPYSIKLEPEAIAIIKQYPSKTNLINVSQTFQHHKSFYRKINNYLKGEKAHHIVGILQILGIHKEVTTKWAKHTWATIARNDCRINKDDVALCLGHEDTDNRVTDIYVKYDYTIIDDSNRKVLDFIKY